MFIQKSVTIMEVYEWNVYNFVIIIIVIIIITDYL